jgi:hypothetical protein
MNRRNDDIVLKLYNASLGRPTAAMRTNYQQEFEAIVNVSNYQEFLDRLGCDYTPEQMTILLRNAVRAACVKHYGGLKLIDLIGETVMEKLPQKETTMTTTMTTWGEVNKILSSTSFEEIKIVNKKKWLERRKELRKQEKIQREHNTATAVMMTTNLQSKDHSKNLNQMPSSSGMREPNSSKTKNWKISREQQSEETEKGQSVRREVSWSGEKDWGRKSRRASKEFDRIDQSAQPILRQRSDADSDWRKR